MEEQMSTDHYDSTADTLRHICRVKGLLSSDFQKCFVLAFTLFLLAGMVSFPRPISGLMFFLAGGMAAMLVIAKTD